MLARIEVRSTFIEKINTKQFEDENDLKEKTLSGKAQDEDLEVESVLNFKGRICVSQVDELIQNLLTESHGSRYSIHLGVTKMYQDFKVNLCMVVHEKNIAEFVAVSKM